MAQGRHSVFIFGGGAREHAAAWKFDESPHVGQIYYAGPRNPGMDKLATYVGIGVTEETELANFAQAKSVDLAWVGPEQALVSGVVDMFRVRGRAIFGPTSGAAGIEGSKAFAKLLMERARIPTAPFEICHTAALARSYVRRHGVPIVVKADGLAGGKGVSVCRTEAQAEEAIVRNMIQRVNGIAGEVLVMEDLLQGEELSIHVLADRNGHVTLSSAQDHKPVGEGDTGPMTSGMGAITPVPWVTDEMMATIENQIVTPLLSALKTRELPFEGCMFPGLMMTPDGPQVLEVNCRPGDPEWQAHMRRSKSDIFEVSLACAEGRLSSVSLKWDPRTAVSLTIASGGYPGKGKPDIPIYGVHEAELVPGVMVFVAGAKFIDGQLVTGGGRELSVTALGDTLQDALNLVYKATGRISFEGMYYRHDIGQRALARMRAK